MLQNLAITRYYIHADAALSGMILPWVDDPQPFGFDAGVDSIAVSGHKLIGSPMPCGVVLAKRSHVDRVARNVEYVGCMDTTIAGSRNALSPLVLWSALQRWGEDGLRARVRASLDMAEYAVQHMRAAGIPAWRHRNSLTVVFPRPGQDLIARWHLAPSAAIAHLITMPHVTAETIDRITAEIAASLSTPASSPTMTQIHIVTPAPAASSFSACPAAPSLTMKQILIITPPDHPGTLADIARRLGDRGVNITDIDVSDDHAHGVIRLHAEPYDNALRILSDAGYHAMSEDVLVIRIQDEPGAITGVAARFHEPSAINVLSLRILQRSNGWVTLLLGTSDNLGARELMKDCVV
jgi:hypothetical protein